MEIPALEKLLDMGLAGAALLVLTVVIVLLLTRVGPNLMERLTTTWTDQLAEERELFKRTIEEDRKSSQQESQSVVGRLEKIEASLREMIQTLTRFAKP